MKLIDKIKRWLFPCSYYGIPKTINGHWQPFTHRGGYDTRYGGEVLMFDNTLERQGIVDLIRQGDVIHQYKITRVGFVEGGDWGGVTNKEFDLVYHSTLADIAVKSKYHQ